MKISELKRYNIDSDGDLYRDPTGPLVYFDDLTDEWSLDTPGTEMSEKEWDTMESLETAMTVACDKAGYHFGAGEGAPIASQAALKWIKENLTIDKHTLATLRDCVKFKKESLKERKLSEYTTKDGNVLIDKSLKKLSRAMKALSKLEVK